MQRGRISLSAVCTLGLLFGQLSSLPAENWPSWRGPAGNGISQEKNLPSQWDRETHVAWRLPLPGSAGATPCIWEDTIFLTSADKDGALLLLCVGTDGKERWRKTLAESGDKRVRNDEGNMASPSPTTDGKHVWAMMGTGDLACYDFAGNEKWKFNLQDRYGEFRIQFGMASTPLLHGDRLYLQLIHGDGKANTEEAYVLCVEKSTGKQVWKSSRITGAYAENEHSYASPILYDDGKTQYLITHGADHSIAYNLHDGSERWRLEGLNPQNSSEKRYHPTLRFVASPAANEGIVVVPTAKNGPVFCVDGKARGTVDEDSASLLWSLPNNTPDVPSPLIHEGLVYLCRENGNLMCLDAKTGTQHYQEMTHRSRHRASPVYADGKIFTTARDGKISVIKAGPAFELLSQNDLGEEISASPAISNGTIYLRTFDALWAIRK